MPLLRDSRLLTIEQALSADPADNRTLAQWASLVGAAPRTLTRLFLKESNMSFRLWRDQFRALSAIPRLIEGVSVTELAMEFGYETSGAFAGMFKRVMGASPSQYLAGDRSR
jgi:AraC-like DNA-binding protein